jgi:hypothetical protein
VQRELCKLNTDLSTIKEHQLETHLNLAEHCDAFGSPPTSVAKSWQHYPNGLQWGPSQWVRIMRNLAIIILGVSPLFPSRCCVMVLVRGVRWNDEGHRRVLQSKGKADRWVKVLP